MKFKPFIKDSQLKNECESQLKRILNNLETAKLSSVEAKGLEHELSVEE